MSPPERPTDETREQETCRGDTCAGLPDRETRRHWATGNRQPLAHWVATSCRCKSRESCPVRRRRPGMGLAQKTDRGAHVAKTFDTASRRAGRHDGRRALRRAERAGAGAARRRSRRDADGRRRQGVLGPRPIAARCSTPCISPRRKTSPSGSDSTSRGSTTPSRRSRRRSSRNLPVRHAPRPKRARRLAATTIVISITTLLLILILVVLLVK